MALPGEGDAFVFDSIAHLGTDHDNHASGAVKRMAGVFLVDQTAQQQLAVRQFGVSGLAAQKIVNTL